MTKYTEIDNGSEIVIEWDDNGIIRFIPTDPANSDYAAYLKYLEDNK